MVFIGPSTKASFSQEVTNPRCCGGSIFQKNNRVAVFGYDGAQKVVEQKKGVPVGCERNTRAPEDHL